MFPCVLIRVFLCLCTRICPSHSGHQGASSTRSHNKPEFINVVHFLMSDRLRPPGCSTLQSYIPHTPLELRERPVARQGASSGMSLLSQGARMEGGREQEVRAEGSCFARLTQSGLLDLYELSIITSLITTQLCPRSLFLLRCMPWAQSEHIGI